MTCYVRARNKPESRHLVPFSGGSSRGYELDNRVVVRDARGSLSWCCPRYMIITISNMGVLPDSVQVVHHWFNEVNTDRYLIGLLVVVVV